MKIVADAQLAGVRTLFAGLGELLLVPATELRKELLADADALLVRSLTPVNAELLDQTAVRFVGTATSGTDHIDIGYLRRRGITLADAKGSNANAVVDYCMTALAATLDRAANAGAVVGLVGYGHIGRAMAGRLDKLGIDTRVCDPPLAEQGCTAVRFEPLPALRDCPVLSLHVPLVRGGGHPTAGLIDGAFVDGLPGGSVLINTCRGGVVDEAALLRRLRKDKTLRYVADVWRGEPEPDALLVEAAALATPHIAGYSRRAKLQATWRLARAFCDAFPCPGDTGPEIMERPELFTPGDGADSWQVLLQALPLPKVSAAFKQAVAGNRAAAGFSTIRRQMLKRREFRELCLPPAIYTPDLEAHGFHKGLKEKMRTDQMTL